MSGGVDSSVAAALLVEQGHEVAGVTLKLWGGPSDQGCCTVADVDDARRVAAQLGIDHHVFNMTDSFDQLVVDPYVESHRTGRTPNPCIECNRHLKFGMLLDAARRLRFDALATGHHARIDTSGDSPQLRRGADGAKDQSYVLAMLTSEHLSDVLLPVGEMTKVEVRAIAERLGLRTAAKQESQDTCFISSSGGRREFLESRTTLGPGQLVDAVSGDVVGTVSEMELVTVGQRRRLGVDAEGERRVAVAIDTTRREILVASPERSLLRTIALEGESMTWTGSEVEDGTLVSVQLRAHGDPALARLESGRLDFETPVAPVAPGQTAALYDAADLDRVLGSGVVAR